MNIQKRLEEIRQSIRDENISYGELAELRGLVKYIDKGDVELLEVAGVPEFPITKKEIKKRLEEIVNMYWEWKDNPEHCDKMAYSDAIEILGDIINSIEEE